MAGLTPLPKESEPFFDQRTKKLSRSWWRFFADTRVQIVAVDTSNSAQSIDLASLDGRLMVIKDVSGNATANPITLLGTVDGVVNPTIATDYGVLKIFGYNATWQSW